MKKENYYMAIRPWEDYRQAWVKLLKSILLKKENSLIREKLKMLDPLKEYSDCIEYGDCILTITTSDARELVTLVMDELVTKYRIKDGAKIAGLLTATVDAALSQADSLREELERFESIKEAIKEIYEKDIQPEQ